jgi:hypothetical protein
MKKTRLVLTLAGLLAATPALASGTSKHSGTVTAVDSAKHTITIEEMGPWAPQRNTLERRTLELGPTTKVVLVERSKGANAQGWRGGFTESPLKTSDVRPGDYVSVTAARKDGRLAAVAVDVDRPVATHAAVPHHTTSPCCEGRADRA